MNIIHPNTRLFTLTISIFLLFSFSQIIGQSEEKIELVKIEILGNDYFDSSELEDLIISKESPWWGSQFLFSFSDLGSPASYFDSLDIESDVTILKNYYKTHGFFKPEISADFIIESNGSKEATLTFRINENEPFLIRNYLIKGIEELPNDLSSDLFDLVELDSTNQYSEKLLEKNNSNIVGLLQDHGYMLIQTSTPIVEIDTAANVVDITSEFKLGNRYRISEVNVSKSGTGKDLVSDKLIDEIANISSGVYYSYNDLKLAQVRLYRTNLFSSAVISGSVPDTVGQYVPVNIITKVGLLNELSPEIILLNEEQTVKFGLGLSYVNKNFLGDARKLTVGVSSAAQDITEFIQGINFTNLGDSLSGYVDARASIEQPFLFGRTINTTFETFYTLEKKRKQWNAGIYGGKLNLNFELPRYIYLTALSTHFTLQHSRYDFDKDYVEKIFSSSNIALNVEQKDSLITSLSNTPAISTSVILGVNLVSNNTDDFIFPTEGYSVSLLFEDGNSIPYLVSKIGNYNYQQAAYTKWVFTSTAYLSDTKNIFDSFGFKIKVGSINAYHGNRNEISYNQRLTAGGSNSLRGWGANELPVSDYVVPQSPTKDDFENILRNIPPGGFFLFEGSVEGREHLSDLIGMAFFVDYGNVWDTHLDFRFDEIAVAAGFGFRFYLDIASIRLDFGFKAYDPQDKRGFFTRITKSPFLKTFKFQFGIGEAF